MALIETTNHRPGLPAGEAAGRNKRPVRNVTAGESPLPTYSGPTTLVSRPEKPLPASSRQRLHDIRHYGFAGGSFAQTGMKQIVPPCCSWHSCLPADTPATSCWLPWNQ
jgi:hypothetical protein